MRSLLLFLAAPLLALGAEISLQTPRFSILSEDGSPIRSEQLSLDKKPDTNLKLDDTNILRLNFNVVDKESGKGLQPHQTFIRFYDPISGEEGVQPLRVTSAGKGKFDLNMRKPPLWLPPTPVGSVLEVSLIVGSFKHTPFSHVLFDLELPKTKPAPKHADDAMYHPRPEISHTFRPEQTIPPKIISAVFAVLAVSPWAVLLGLWSQLPLNAPKLTTSQIAPFFGLLAAFEALLVRYWIGLKLGQVLTYGAVLGVFTLIAGKRALVATGKWRLQSKQ